MVIAAVEPQPTPTPSPAPTPTPPSPEPTPQDWRLQIPDDLRLEKSLAQIKDIPSLARGYVEAQKSFGSRIPLPSEKDTPEQRQEKLKEIWGKLGRPDTADGYGIGEPEGLPEGVPWNMDVQKEFLGHAHSLGLTKDQALGVLEWYGERVSTVALSQRQEAGKIIEQLKGEWGAAYDRNIAIAQRAVDAIGGPKLKEYFKASGLGNSGEMIRAFAKVGKLLAEAQMISGRVEGVLGPEEAKAKIAAVLADPKHLYHPSFAGKPGHAEAVADMKALHELAYPGSV